MPVPAGITQYGVGLHLTNTITMAFDAPRAKANNTTRHVTKQFHCYVELYMQSKHSDLLKGHCRDLGFEPRMVRGTKCDDGNNALTALGANGFYAARSATAADVVYHHMRGLWAGPQGHGPIIGAGRVDCGVQAIEQDDGYYYEVSYFYNGDVYLFYHCYPDD